jgi:hypothetical protein
MSAIWYEYYPILNNVQLCLPMYMERCPNPYFHFCS